MNRAESKLLIVYDNKSSHKGMTPAWGFSCLIRLPQYQLLFDTGGDPRILLRNMREMNVDPERIYGVVLSHAHGDHVGGLGALLNNPHHVHLYVPRSFPESLREELRLMGAQVLETADPSEIHPGVYSTGELGSGMVEQSVVLKTCQGLVIITGCAHPGIVKITERVRKLFNERVYLLIGGFHLMGLSPKTLKDIAQELVVLNVARVAPCHCSGDAARDVFREYFGKRYLTCSAGSEIELPHPGIRNSELESPSVK